MCWWFFPEAETVPRLPSLWVFYAQIVELDLKVGVLENSRHFPDAEYGGFLCPFAGFSSNLGSKLRADVGFYFPVVG